MPYCVGLTGGTGSGKSSAARIFGALGAGVVDVDDISHALTKADGAAHAAIRSQFEVDTIAPDGSLDRAHMRKRVFENAAAKSELETILHPRISLEARNQVTHAPQPYVMLAAPLLLERNAYNDVIQRHCRGRLFGRATDPQNPVPQRHHGGGRTRDHGGAIAQSAAPGRRRRCTAQRRRRRRPAPASDQPARALSPSR